MPTKQQMLNAVNNSNLGGQLGMVKKALLSAALSKLAGDVAEDAEDAQAADARLLEAAGPAWAAAAVRHAVRAVKGRPGFGGVSWNGSVVHNVRQVQNLGGDCYDQFGGAIRQFLSRQVGRFNFDSMLGGRHRVAEECGHPAFITPAMYNYLYNRSETARRVNDIYADESWAVPPRVYDDEAEDVTTPFEEDWQNLCDEFNLLSVLYRLDKLCGVGRYGGLLVGLDDGKDLSKPAEGYNNDGTVNTKFDGTQKVIYLRPFDEYLTAVRVLETNENNVRYGMPLLYNVIFADAVDSRGTVVGTQQERVIHWTRMAHVADNLMTSPWAGVPRMQPVWDRLLDVRKLYGGSAEMFWQGAFPGIAYEIDPSIIADDPEFDDDALRAEIQEYRDGLRRDLRLLGVKAHSLAPQVADPQAHVMVQLRAIAMHFGIPIRIFLGSEEAKLASSQDKVNWNQRLGRRLRNFLEPGLMRVVVDRFRALRVLRPPKDNKYKCDWTDLNTVADEDKANLALKWTQALSQYVTTGIIHLIKPLEFLTIVMGLSPADALRVIKIVEDKGGFAKLEAVDPAKAQQKPADQTGNKPDKRASGMTG